MEIIKLFTEHNIHALAMTTLDTTDSSIVRLIVDDPEATEALFEEHMIPFAQTDVLGVEIAATTDVPKVLASLLEAEINIHYIYAFISRPNDKLAMAIHVEDPEIAEQALTQKQLKVLHQGDVSR